MQKYLNLLSLLFLVILLGCKQDKNIDSTIPFTKEATLEIVNSEQDTLRFDVELAQTEYQQSQGLMNRYKMEDNQGMFFIFNNNIRHSFWMKNTYLSLDIIFIDKDFKISQIYENAFPLSEETILSDIPCLYVLEIKGGLSSKLNIQTNDTVKLIR